MTISVNLGVGMEVNSSGVDPKQKGYANIHSIIVTSPVLAKENIFVIYPRRRII